MSESFIRISRRGSILGDFTLDQVQEGARSGNFLPSDDILPRGGTRWSKLAGLEGVVFLKTNVEIPPAESAPPPRPPEYSGIYCSSDQKLLLGFCGGLAHRLGFAPGIARFAFVAIVILTGSIAFWLYWFTFLLPKLPTRSVA